MLRVVPAVLFWLCVLAAAGEAGIVLLAPRWLASDEPAAVLLRLYATDATLRRVTLAGAAGLIGTALIFFRPTPVRFGRVRRADGSVPEVNDLAGA